MNRFEAQHTNAALYSASRSKASLFTMYLLIASLIYPAIVSFFQGNLIVATIFLLLSFVLLLIPLFNKMNKQAVSVAIIIHVSNVTIHVFNIFIVHNILNLFSIFPLIAGIFHLNPLPVYKKELITHFAITLIFTSIVVLYFFYVPVHFYTPQPSNIFAIINLLICLAVTMVLIFLQGRNAVRIQTLLNTKIAENKVLVKELESTIYQKNILLAEVHHRIKNYLATVSGLLNWQKSISKDREVQNVLNECSKRIMSIALVNKKLYERGEYNEISIDEYIKELCEDIQSTSPNVEIKLDLSVVFANVEKATPCGLIINEVITNCFKHAFVNEKHPLIAVELKKNKDMVVLMIKDNGIGMPSKSILDKQNSMGHHLIEALTEQIDGKFEYFSGGGTQFMLHFPLNKI